MRFVLLFTFSILMGCSSCSNGSGSGPDAGTETSSLSAEDYGDLPWLSETSHAGLRDELGLSGQCFDGPIGPL